MIFPDTRTNRQSKHEPDQNMKTKLTTLLLACGAVATSPLVTTAQEGRPTQDRETIKPAQPTSGPRPEGERRHEGDHRGEGDRAKHDGDKGVERREHRGRGDQRDDRRENPKAPETKLVTYLGLMAHPLSLEVAAQAGVPHGFGLMVAEVMDGSPAKQAGFEKYDVLVLIGDQRIVNLEQFQALVRSQKKGDEVTLTIRRKGQEMKVSAKLGERAMPVDSGHSHPMMPPHGGHGPGAHRYPGMRGLGPRFGGGDVKERAGHFREMMRERLQKNRDGDGDHGPGSPGFGPGAMKERAGHFREMMRERFEDRRDGDRRPMAQQFGAGPMMNGRFGPPGPMAGGRGNAGPAERQGPRAPSEKRDGDHARPGAPLQGGHFERPMSGPRPGAGPQHEGPRPDGQTPSQGVRPGPDAPNRGPHGDGPHREGVRPAPDGAPRPDGAADVPKTRA